MSEFSYGSVDEKSVGARSTVAKTAAALSTIVTIACLAVFFTFLGDTRAAGTEEHSLQITDTTFRCISKMTPVRDFFVDNLTGNLQGTLAVARAGHGRYPEGTVLQLIPNEAMIKQQPGYSPKTNDWEFFALKSSKDGTKIVSRGRTEVNNFLGLNCFACHKAARSEFDLVCQQNHGCTPLPLTEAMFHAVQDTDPRCRPAKPVTAEDTAALKALGPAIKKMLKNEAAVNKKTG